MLRLGMYACGLVLLFTAVCALGFCGPGCQDPALEGIANVSKAINGK